MSFYSEILKPYRLCDDKNTNNLFEELCKDSEYIVKSSLFRKLQIKTQVFPLVKSSSVRTRLTHTLEVAENSQKIAFGIAEKLYAKGKIERENIFPFIKTCTNASLLHDIGNPPFGHFGEETIKKWFLKNWQSLSKEAGLELDNKIKLRINDFTDFDGNPQGIRFAFNTSNFGKECSSLTLSTILSTIKYPRDSLPTKSKKYKKNGYFQSDRQNVLSLYEKISWDEKIRFPLSYIMEAADDLSYFFSDVEDSLEQNILQNSEFIILFKEAWAAEYGNKEKLPFCNDFNLRESFVDQITPILISNITKELIQVYVDKEEFIINGDIKDLVEETTHSCKILKIIKGITKKYIYRCPAVEEIEIAGHIMISSILNHFSILLKLPRSDFESLIKGDDRIKSTKSKLEGRFFNRIEKELVKEYEFTVKSLQKENNYTDVEEWIARCHLIIDYISGMTDNFVLSNYQMFEGISL